jgi:hypothetical protein
MQRAMNFEENINNSVEAQHLRDTHVIKVGE